MNCPYFYEGKCNQCAIFKGLFIPSIYEERKFCRSSGHYTQCGIYREYQESSSRINKEDYVSRIESDQYAAV